MTATNNRMFERLDEIGSFFLNKFNPLLLQICFIWKSLQCMPSFVWISTNRTTQHKKLNIFKQTVSKNIVTRPSNNGCGEHLHVLYAIVKRNFGCSTRNVTEKMAPFKMANASNLEELLQSKNGLLRKKPLVYLIYLLNSYVRGKYTFTCIFLQSVNIFAILHHPCSFWVYPDLFDVFLS